MECSPKHGWTSLHRKSDSVSFTASEIALELVLPRKLLLRAKYIYHACAIVLLRMCDSVKSLRVLMCDFVMATVWIDESIDSWILCRYMFDFYCYVTKELSTLELKLFLGCWSAIYSSMIPIYGGWKWLKCWRFVRNSPFSFSCSCLMCVGLFVLSWLFFTPCLAMLKRTVRTNSWLLKDMTASVFVCAAGTEEN